jgi:alkyl hydroperoxide reductase subunit AhpF
LSGAADPSELVIPASPGTQQILSPGQLSSIEAWWARAMAGPVRVQLLVDGPGCEACEVTARVVQQLQRASRHLTVNVALARTAAGEPPRLDRLPETRVHTRTGSTIRFFGTQVGVEVTSLVQTIADASLDHSPLPPDLVRSARALPEGSWVRVFVGPACTHCPGAVRAAVALGLANPSLSVEVVVTPEFPELARRFRVSAVPTTVVNGRAFFEDPRRPAELLEALHASPPD